MVTSAKNEIPVLLLTGYLGSGKTTLVNRILSNKQGIRFAVIVNDLGEVNIDAELIQQGGVVGQDDDSLVALQNGCICCTLKMNLVEQLRGLVEEKRFDYIVIEASGICEPEPIAQTICSIPYMEAKYRENGLPVLDCIVTVVDAVRMRDEFCDKDLATNHFQEEDLENLIIQQIEFCDRILLNKASEVSPDMLGKIQALLRALQPKAEIIPCDYGNVPLEKLLDTGLFNFDRTSTSAAWVRVVENIQDEEEEEEHEHEHEHDHEHEHKHEHEHEEEHDGHGHHHHHHADEGEAEEYGISTFVYKAHAPFQIDLFDDFVNRYLIRKIIRSKGTCYFRNDMENCYVFDQVGKQVVLREAGQWYATMPQSELGPFLQRHPEVLQDWDDTYGDRMQKLVFIGQHLEPETLREWLDRCLVE